MTGSESSSSGHHPSQPRGSAGGVLKDKPLHATFARKATVPSSEGEYWVTEVFRNRAGSVRTDLQPYSSILDVKGSRLITLLRAEKIALVTPATLDGSADFWGFNGYPIGGNESVSLMEITCRRLLISNSERGPHDAGELWVAYDLGLALKDIKTTPDGDITWEVNSLSLTEPDPLVFEIPEGYSVNNFSA